MCCGSGGGGVRGGGGDWGIWVGGCREGSEVAKCEQMLFAWVCGRRRNLRGLLWGEGRGVLLLLCEIM